MSDPILKRIQNVVGRVLRVNPSRITLQSTPDDLGIDSLDAIEIIIELEREFDVTITDTEAMQWERADDAVEYIQKRLSSQESGEDPRDTKRPPEELVNNFCQPIREEGVVQGLWLMAEKMQGAGNEAAAELLWQIARYTDEELSNVENAAFQKDLEVGRLADKLRAVQEVQLQQEEALKKIASAPIFGCQPSTSKVRMRQWARDALDKTSEANDE